MFKIKRIAGVVVSVGSAVVALPSHAALDAGVSTAITAYQTDATAAIGLITAAGVVIWGLLKLASKMGWR